MKDANVRRYVRFEAEGLELADPEILARAAEILECDEVFMATVPDDDREGDHDWMTDENIDAAHLAIMQACDEKGVRP